MFGKFISIFTSIVSAPFAVLDTAISPMFGHPDVRAIGVCVVASVVYAALCYLVSLLGWRYRDYADGCARYWWLPVRGMVLQVAAKLLLAAAHIAVYTAIWSGFTSYNYLNTPGFFRAICWLITVGSIVASSMGLFATRIRSADCGAYSS